MPNTAWPKLNKSTYKIQLCGIFGFRHKTLWTAPESPAGAICPTNAVSAPSGNQQTLNPERPGPRLAARSHGFTGTFALACFPRMELCPGIS